VFWILERSQGRRRRSSSNCMATQARQEGIGRANPAGGSRRPCRDEPIRDRLTVNTRVPRARIRTSGSQPRAASLPLNTRAARFANREKGLSQPPELFVRVLAPTAPSSPTSEAPEHGGLEPKRVPTQSIQVFFTTRLHGQGRRSTQ